MDNPPKKKRGRPKKVQEPTIPAQVPAQVPIKDTFSLSLSLKNKTSYSSSGTTLEEAIRNLPRNREMYGSGVLKISNGDKKAEVTLYPQLLQLFLRPTNAPFQAKRLAILLR